MPAIWYEAEVIAINNLTFNVKSFSLQVKDSSEFKFKAGQFITFDLPVGEKRLQRWKSYSLANAPDGSNLLELCIVHFPDGLGSSYFFKEVKVGTVLKFKGPEGGFHIPDLISTDLVLICTGTGIAPFISMLRYIYSNNVEHKRIHLIFGTRTASDVLYLDELKKFESEITGFSYDITLSRDLTDLEDPHFHTGYVHSMYLQDCTYENTTHFYICGWSKMIDEAVDNLFTVLKVARDKIHYELYG